MLDINITHTYSPTYVANGSAFKPSSLLGKISKDKHVHYDAQAASVGAKLVTFCLNTHGGMHQEAVKFCKNLALHATESDPARWTYTEALRFIITTVTNEFHTANGLFIESCMEQLHVRSRQLLVNNHAVIAPPI